MGDFNTPWFENQRQNWEKHVLPNLPDIPDRHALEIGSFEGRSAVWTAENILKGGGVLTCVDPWDTAWMEDRPVRTRAAFKDMNMVYSRFLANIAHVSHAVRAVRTDSSSFFLSGKAPSGLAFAYVDGDHNARSCLHDMVQCFHRLVVGGIMVVDDYLWSMPKKAAIPPKPAVDAFLECYGPVVELLHLGGQAIIRKTENP